MTIPTTISSTTDGRRTDGKKPRTSGAANPAATMISRFVNARSRAASRDRGTARAYASRSPARHRMYGATALEHFVLSERDERIAVDPRS
jgi:hypothetical protein